MWLLVVATAVAATEPIPLTWENIVLENHGARDAVISPDGKWVAVSAGTPDGSGIYLVSTSGGEPEFWVEGRSPSWAPDGSRITFSDLGDLWTVGLKSKERLRITSDPEDEREATFSPDGSMLAFYSTRSGHQDIWLVAADGTAPPSQLTEEAMAEDDYRFAPAWSPNGKQIAYISNHEDYWEDDVWVIEVESKKTRRISRKLMASSTPVWSADGKRIAILGTDKDEYWYEDLAYIYLIDPKDRKEERLEMQIYATDWLHNHRLFWSGDGDGERLTFLYHERGDLNLWSVPSEGGLATRVSSMGGAVRSFHATAKGDAFVLVRSTPTRGNDVDYITDIGGEAQRLTRFAQEWDSIQEPKEISYRSFDGLYIQGFLYLPPGAPGSRTYPALVHVHGGGTNAYLRRQNLTEQYLASKGYVVLAINYRGGSGFGREFQDLSINDWVNGQAADAAAAADFLRSLPTCNEKVGIYGYSYGGIMSMGTIARHPEKFDAAVPMAGIYDFADAYQNADRVGKIFLKTGHGGDPEDREEVYAISNTLARLENIRTPLLVMHGEEDVRAPYRQYQLAVETLERRGKVFEAKSYPGEPHGFRNPQNRIDMYQRLEAFFDRYLK
jgi:dipeptidyl aminopeptidase/acylaminoacyl peptidase